MLLCPPDCLLEIMWIAFMPTLVGNVVTTNSINSWWVLRENCIPHQLKPDRQLQKSSRRGMLLNLLGKTATWPLESTSPSSLKEGIYCPGMMWIGPVILEECVREMKWQKAAKLCLRISYQLSYNPLISIIHTEHTRLSGHQAQSSCYVLNSLVADNNTGCIMAICELPLIFSTVNSFFAILESK